MPLPVFENAYLLQALGWAIANSFWQTGILWLMYLLVTGVDKKLSALVKHHLGLVLLSTSFVWFCITLLENYRLLSDGSAVAGIFPGKDWLLNTQSFSNVLPILSVIYLVLLGFYLARFINNLSANRILQTKGLTKAPLDFRLFATQTAFHLGIKKTVRVWLSDHVDVPCVTGFLKPVILLPAAIINQLSIQQTEAILLHELAHIKRNDYLVNLFQYVLELILFFNPFAILLSKAAKKERENCCDDWVMNFQYDNYEYARALLLLEEQRHLGQFRFALGVTNNGKRNLLLRVKRLFSADTRTDFSSSQKIKLVGLCVLLLNGIVTVLPSLTKNPPTVKSLILNGKALVPVTTVEKSTENTAKNIIKNQPVKPLIGNERKLVISSRKPKKNLSVKSAPDYYVDAFVNEDLLNPAPPAEPVINQVVEKAINKERVFVKIEEQQSGEKQTNTYYFEVNNHDGDAAIKPLIMLNSIKASPKKIPLKNLIRAVDSLAKPMYKKKITS